MKKDINNILQGFLKTAGRQLGSGLIQLLTIILISRNYGPEGSGSYIVITLLPITLANFFNMGIGSANIYYIGSRKFSLEQVVPGMFRVGYVASVVGFIIGAGVITFGSENLFPNIDKNFLYLSLSILPFLIFNQYIISVFQAIQDFKKYNLLLLIQPFLMFFFVSTLTILENKSIYNLIYALIASSLSCFVLSLYYLSKLKRKGCSSKKNTYIKPALNYGIKAHISNMVAFVNNKADIYFVSILLNPASVGFYTIAVQFSEKIWIVSQALSTVLLPKLSELTDDEYRKKEIVLAISKLVFYITSLISIFVAIVAKYMILFFFGEEFYPAVEPLIYLLPGVIFMTVARVLANDLSSRGRPELNMYTSVVIIITNVLGNLILVPIYGISGAAMSTSFSYIFNCILRCLMYRHYTKINILDLFIPSRNDFHNIRSSLSKGIKALKNKSDL
ncbi:flippase [Vibrio splendidus]|uniref:Flippase n=1 Tax=Vibrio splendidus TaxID=29497 RepID=A0ABD5AGC2_VIBSP|nr:flippase [Vibrio splendidus]MDP2492209.1 flippase [Vibrio splendidus]PMO50570.1 hypothetical protein BCT08_23510 [Vibrio splendidus]